MATAAGRAQGGSRLERWAGLGGVLYVVLFIAGGIVSFSGQPDSSSAPAKIVSYYSDSGHRDKIDIGWILFVLSVFFFIWFLGGLRQLLRRRTGDDGFLTAVVTVGGAVYAATTLVGTSLNAAIKTMSDDTFQHTVYPSLIHATDDAGYVIHSSGGLAVGALMIAASLAAMGAALIPRWLGIVGVVFGVLAIFSLFFFPQLAIALWVLVAGVLLFRSGGTSRGQAAAPGPAV